MNGVLHDLRFTVRNMARNPGLAVVIAISLALGIGANTAIFSLIRTVLMTSLPVKDADRLVLLHWHGETWPSGMNQSGAGGPNNPAYKSASRSLAYPFFRQLSADTSTFESVFAFAPLGSERQNTTLAAEDGGERVDGEMVSGDYFRGLGASATVGRLITRDDEARAAQVAVLSYPYWTRRFGGDPSIVGREVTINHLPFTIVGVTSQRFFGVQPGRVPDVWVAMLDSADLAPWGYHPSDGSSLLDIRSYWWTHVMARLKDGVDERAAQVKADAIFQSFVADALPQADPKLPPHIGFEPGAIGIDTLRASYGDALLLSSGELIRHVAFALRKSDDCQCFASSPFALAGGHTGIEQRQFHIFESGSPGHQIETLKYKSHSLVPHIGKLGLAHCRNINTFQKILSLGRAIQTSNDVHQRGFSRPGRSHDRHVLSPLNFQ